MVVNYILLNVLRKKRKPTVRPPVQKSLQGLIRQPSVQIFITDRVPAIYFYYEEYFISQIYRSRW